MHDIRFIRDNTDTFDRALAWRGLSSRAQRLIALDKRRRAKTLALESAQAGSVSSPRSNWSASLKEQ
jgi:seryl-tRNA synthetase